MLSCEIIKNMLLLEFLNVKGVFLFQQALVNLCFSVRVFLNFAKGMICNYYKSCVVVVSPLTSLISMKDQNNVLKRKKKQAMDSKCNSSMLEEGSY